MGRRSGMGRPHPRDLGLSLRCCVCSDGGSESRSTDAAQRLNVPTWSNGRKRDKINPSRWWQEECLVRGLADRSLSAGRISVAPHATAVQQLTPRVSFDPVGRARSRSPHCRTAVSNRPVRQFGTLRIAFLTKAMVKSTGGTVAHSSIPSACAA